MNDTPVGDDNLHPYVVFLGRNSAVNQLKIVTKPDQMGRSAGVLQKTVIKSLAVADTMAVRIKGHPRHHNQVRFVGEVVDPGRAGFQDAETALAQMPQFFDLPENHALAAYGRVQDFFPGCKRRFKDFDRVGFLVGRGIQGDAVCPRKLLKRDKLTLSHATGRQPLVVSECPALCKYLLAE